MSDNIWNLPLSPPTPPPLNSVSSSAVDAVMPPPPGVTHIHITEEWLTRMVGTRLSLPDVWITPDYARVLLTRNTSNRPVHAKHLDRLTVDVNRDGWVNTGEPCIYNEDGTMNEGQHRLLMIVATGKPATLDLRFGVSRAAMSRSGTGLRRSGGDNMAIQGYKNATIVAAIARGVHLHLNNKLESNAVLPPVVLVQTMNDYPWISDMASMVTTAKIRHLRKAWVGVGLSIVRMAGNADIELKLFNHAVAARLAHPESGSNGAMLLHDRMIDSSDKKKKTGFQVMSALTPFMNAWNCWAEGRVLTILRGWTPGATLPPAVRIKPTTGRS